MKDAYVCMPAREKKKRRRRSPGEARSEDEACEMCGSTPSFIHGGSDRHTVLYIEQWHDIDPSDLPIGPLYPCHCGGAYPRSSNKVGTSLTGEAFLGRYKQQGHALHKSALRFEDRHQGEDVSAPWLPARAPRPLVLKAGGGSPG